MASFNLDCCLYFFFFFFNYIGNPKECDKGFIFQLQLLLLKTVISAIELVIYVKTTIILISVSTREHWYCGVKRACYSILYVCGNPERCADTTR